MDDHTQALPEDAIADILSRLAPRDLAASRCVRKAWLAVIDAHRLLLPHVLPLSVRGLFINYFGYNRPKLFARPSAQPAAGNLTFLQSYWDRYNIVMDHCNGLLLCNDLGRTLCVANPATRQWEDFPWEDANASPHLVFDPFASAHYEVFSIPRVPRKVLLRSPPPKKLPKKVPKKGVLESTTPRRGVKSGNLGGFSGPYGLIKLFSLPTDESVSEDVEEDDFEDGSTESSSEQYKQKSDVSTGLESLPTERIDHQEDSHDLEWPPSLWTLNVFSSSTKQWHMRSFVREGEAIGTMTIVRPDRVEHILTYWRRNFEPRWGCSAYWQGSLYVHCSDVFSVRLSLSDCKYQVIRAPIDIEKTKHAQFLGKSEKGVYLATMESTCKLRVWSLTESIGRIDWMLRHDVDLDQLSEAWLHGLRDFDKTWTIADDDDILRRCYDYYCDDDEDKEEDDNDVNVEVEVEEEDDKEEGVQKENNDSVTSEDHEWNSDDDNVLNIEHYDTCYGSIYFLGFHPYKEVVFLGLQQLVGVAYHLKSSKVQNLGAMRPKDCDRSPTNGIYEAFPYTPCMIGELLNHASEVPSGLKISLFNICRWSRASGFQQKVARLWYLWVYLAFVFIF